MALVKRIILIFCLLALPVCQVCAHEPHDDIYELEISPEYSKDRTLYIIVRRDLFKSVDGGESWSRLFNGLSCRGYLESLAVAPSNKDVLYVSALGGGLFRSDDAGLTWQHADKGIDELDIDEMLVSPYSENTVICAARSGGVHLTEDGGKSWHPIMPEDVRATSFGFFPQDENRLLIGGDDGTLYQSMDRGKSWEKMFSRDYAGAITAIAVSPNFADNNKFYFGTEGGGFYFTKNGGKDFAKKERDSMSVKHINDIRILPSAGGDDEIVLSTWHEGVFWSPNNGWYWFERSKGLTRDPQADHPGHLEMLGEQGGGEYRRPHFHDIRVSDGYERDKTLFVAGFKGLFRSTDGGWNWKEVDTYSRSVVGISISPDYENNPAIAVATYADGVYVSEDAGRTWASLPQELKYVRDKTLYYLKGESREHYLELLWPRFYDIKFSPDYATDKTLYVMPLHIKTKVFKRVGEDITEVELPEPDSGGAIAFSPDFTEDGIMYLASQKGAIYESRDRGSSFKSVGSVPIEWGHNSVSFCLSPDFTADKTMFFSASTVEGGAFKSTDAGRTWLSVTGGTPLEGLLNIHVAVSPGYTADKTAVAGTEEGVYISRDRGVTWEELSVSGGDKKVYVESLAFSPGYETDGTLLIYARGQGLFKTTDRGETFHRVKDNKVSFMRANIPSGSSPIQFSPNYASDKTIYGYGAAGADISRSTDAGEEWETLSIPEREVTVIDNIKDGVMWTKAWIPVLTWRTKVFFSKTQTHEEALLAAGILSGLFIVVMALRGIFKR